MFPVRCAACAVALPEADALVDPDTEETLCWGCWEERAAREEAA